MELYQKLKDLRKVHGYTQEELAELVGVSRQAISQWETGKSYPDIDNLYFLANLYELSLDELYDKKQGFTNEDELFNKPIEPLKNVHQWKSKKIIFAITTILIIFSILIINKLSEDDDLNEFKLDTYIGEYQFLNDGLEMNLKLLEDSVCKFKYSFEDYEVEGKWFYSNGSIRIFLNDANEYIFYVTNEGELEFMDGIETLGLEKNQIFTKKRR